MENNSFEQIQEAYNRIAGKANLCQSLGIIKNLHTYMVVRDAESFNFEINVNRWEANSHGWNAKKSSYGDDTELHANNEEAQALEQFLDDTIISCYESAKNAIKAIDKFNLNCE